jgi:uncharacterized protein (DUF1778 family)
MSTLKVNNIVAYSGTHVSGTFSGVFSGSFDSSRIDALEAFSSSLDSTFATDLVVNSLSGAFNSFTASLDNTYATDAQLYQLYQATASIHFTTQSLNVQTGSQDLVNLGISTYTGSQNVINTSVDSHILKQATQTGSQDLVNLGVSSVTGSLIGITNTLMAFTAALDNTYATDAQLYELYQATQSLELLSGSLIGITNGLMAYTASNTTLNTGLRGEVDGIEAYTASLKAAAIVSSSAQVQNYDVFALNSNLYESTGSLIGITNGLMAFTAALDSTYATDAQLLPLLQATASLNEQTGSYATTGSNVFSGSQQITGSLSISGSNSTIVLPNHSNAPTSPASGSLYFNTTDFHFYGWNGEQWKQLDN